jgi:uncharacterized protein (UPF0332 family)
MEDPRENYRVYMQTAREMLGVARENLNNHHNNSACNRSYYAVFYAASALLYSKGMTYGKHSAVLAAFRQHFIKTGEFDKKWSESYEFIMDSRHSADYDLYDTLDREDTLIVLRKAEEFVEEVTKWLQKQNLL